MTAVSYHSTETEGGIRPIEVLVRQHPFLQNLSPHQYRVLGDCACQAHFRAGEVLFRQGDPANRFYLIEKGRVAVEAWQPTKGSTIIQTLHDGDVLGWSWLVPPYYWQFSARAVEATDAIFIYGTPLREECEQDHELGYELLKRVTAVMLARLQATRRQLIGSPGNWLTPPTVTGTA